MQNGNEIKETNEYLQVRSETNRIYYDTLDEHLLDTGNKDSSN